MTKAQLDALFVKLEQDFPDSSTTLMVENFVDWLTNYQFESDLQTACLDALLDKQRKAGLSPTGRRPSPPELQHLPRPYQLPIGSLTQDQAEALLQQYRDTFPSLSQSWLAPMHDHPGGFPNFPCVAVDLASGVDYSVAPFKLPDLSGKYYRKGIGFYLAEQHPIQADHASIDDRGGVSVSVLGSLPKWATVMDKTPRHIGANPLLGAPYGSRYNKEMSGPTFRATLEEVRQQTWGNMTPDDIYKDLAESINKVRTPAEQLIQHRLTQTWTISHGTTTISYAPNSAVDIPVLVVSELLDNGVVEVVESCQGEAAAKRARYYLERFEARMKR